MSKTLGAALAAVLAFVSAGMARAGVVPAPDGASLHLPLEGVITNPDWVSKPNGDDFEHEYPPVAALMKVEGQATMTCEVETNGRLEQCRILNESPAGFGFGAAVLRLSAYFTMKPARLDGTPVKGLITVPISFRLGPYAKMTPEELPEGPPTSPAALEIARQVIERRDLSGQMRANWRPILERMTAEVVVGGQGKSGEAVLDALRQGLDDAIRSQVDRIAHRMAAHMSESDLRATLAFLDTPAGKAWTVAELQIAQLNPVSFASDVAKAAKARLDIAPSSSVPVAKVGARP